MSYTIFHFYLQWTDDSAQPIFDLYSEFSYQLKIREYSIHNMALTILTLVFAATCLSQSIADEIKSLKDEIAVIRHLQQGINSEG